MYMLDNTVMNELVLLPESEESLQQQLDHANLQVLIEFIHAFSSCLLQQSPHYSGLLQ